MNKWMGSGRLIKDPEIRYFPQSGKPYAVFALAVPDPYARKNEPDADFLDFIVYDRRRVELIEKYVRKGTKLEIVGRLKSGHYTNNDGAEIYYKRIVVEELEFAESRAAEQSRTESPEESKQQKKPENDFMSIPDGAAGEMPFM